MLALLCRSSSELILFVVCAYPGFCSCLWRSRHPGLCRSVALSGLFVGLFAVSPGFHIGLCPHFTLGYAGVPPLQGSLSDWAFAVLCCGIVFVKCVLGCVNELLRSVVFLYLFDCGCIVCGIGGIDCCGRAMSPKGAILLYSPGRKHWVNHCNTFIEPL